MNNGYQIQQNSVFTTYIGRNPLYYLFWGRLLAMIRPKQTTVTIRGKQVLLPAHTACISVYKTGIPGMSYKQARVMLQKMEKSGYIRVYTQRKQTYIEIQNSILYEYPNTTKPNTRKPAAPRGQQLPVEESVKPVTKRKITQL